MRRTRAVLAHLARRGRRSRAPPGRAGSAGPPRRGSGSRSRAAARRRRPRSRRCGRRCGCSRPPGARRSSGACAARRSASARRRARPGRGSRPRPRGPARAARATTSTSSGEPLLTIVRCRDLRRADLEPDELLRALVVALLRRLRLLRPSARDCSAARTRRGSSARSARPGSRTRPRGLAPRPRRPTPRARRRRSSPTAPASRSLGLVAVRGEPVDDVGVDRRLGRVVVRGRLVLEVCSGRSSSISRSRRGAGRSRRQQRQPLRARPGTPLRSSIPTS